MTTSLSISPGSEEWHELRRRCTEPIPGRYSALYFLTSEILGLREKIPMRPEVHYSMCLFAERATGIPEIDEARVQLIQVPRGYGKSAIVTIGRSVQRLLKHDDYSIGIANETQAMANSFLSQIKLYFETNEALRALFPERIPDNVRDTTWAADQIVIKRKNPRPTPSVISMGVGATRTGMHADEFILDDLISKDAAESAIKGTFTAIEDANRWLTQLSPLLSSPMRDPITIICTPWVYGDTYEFAERYFGNVEGDIEDTPPDFETIWRLRLPGGQVKHHKLYRRGDLAVFRLPAFDDSGNSIFPERWTTEELHDMASKPEGAEFFAANYLLEPSAGLAGEFEVEDLNYYTVDGPTLMFRDQRGNVQYELLRDMMAFISIDPAFSDRQSAARTAIPVIATEGRNLFLMEDFAEHGTGVYDIINKVVGFALEYQSRGLRIHRIFLETIVGQVALLEPLKRALKENGLSGIQIEEIKSHGKQKKDMRIYGLAPYFRRGQFFIQKRHINFLREYQRFPRGSLRDVLDAISFQRDTWEKIFSRGGRGQEQQTQQAEEEAIERIRAVTRKR